MTEIYEKLSTLSIEELTEVIAKSQQLIAEKKAEALRQERLDKERLERERIEKERKRQEEIAELQRRLQELQGQTPTPEPQPIPQPTPQPTPQPQQTYNMISCPYCHKLIESDCRFCYHCGKNLVASAGQPESQPIPQPTPQPAPQSQAGGARVEYMNDSVKKWVPIAGEGDVYAWNDINVLAPEERICSYIKITTKRILISSEGRMQRGLRNSGGLLLYAATAGMEKGKPWVSIPLECVVSFNFIDKKKMQIQADKTYILRGGKVKDIYAVLQQLMPNKAR